MYDDDYRLSYTHRLPFRLFPLALKQREHLVPHRLVIAQIVTERLAQLRPGRKQPIVSGPTSQNPPKSLNRIELRTVAWQAIKCQMGMGRQGRIYDRPAMPGGIVNDDDHLRVDLSRVGPGNIVQMSRKGHLKPPRFALPGLLLDPSRLFHQPGGQCALGDIEGRVAIHQILIVPGPHHRPMPFDAQGGTKGWGQRKARFILTEQHTLAELGFFLTLQSPLGRFVAGVGRL